MTAYAYGHDETVRAANAFWSFVFDHCYQGVPAAFKWGGGVLFYLFGCDANSICSNAANMVLNCTVLGGSYCGSNNANDYTASLNNTLTRARSISPDRLGGLTRFMSELPRPTTWAADSLHPLTWNGAGRVCGCFE